MTAIGPGDDREPLIRLAERFGTPAYVLDVDRLTANYRRFEAALAKVAASTRVLYSLKTNYLPAVVQPLYAAGAGLDVVSGYELAMAQRMGVAGRDIVFNGPVKTRADVAAAVRAGAFVNIDGPEEISLLATAAESAAVTLDVGLRVQAGEDVHGPGRRLYPSKFGWPVGTGDADRALRLIAAQPRLRLVGVHAHLGSQLTQRSRYAAAMAEVGSWIAGARREAPIDRINVGGGFPVPGISRVPGAAHGVAGVGRPAEEAGPPGDDAPDLLGDLAVVLADLKLDDLEVIAEPGRAIVSDAMTLVASVCSVKELRDGRWVLVDAGLNLLPTAGPAEKHHFQCLTRDDGDLAETMLGGPLCYEGDVFGLRVPLPRDIRAGDFVAIKDAGAYSVTRATSFNRLRCQVISVTDGKAAVCWRAETEEDIYAFAVDALGPDERA
jgi:diaminopimelate decarboxylase